MPAVIIKEIKETYFLIREELYIPDPTKMVKIELYHRIGVNTEAKRVKFTLGSYIHYFEKSDKLAEMAIDTVFELPNMNQYQMKNTEMILPSDVLLTMVRESIGHLRALFFVKLKGTPYHNIIIPHDDTEKVTAYFFPNLIKNAQGVMPDLVGKVEA